MLEVKNTPGLVGLQQPSVRTELWYLVHIIGDSLASSDQILWRVKIKLIQYKGKEIFLTLAVQSPKDRKYLG